MRVITAISSVEVRLTTLDQFVAETGLRPDLIKIDTEGTEVKVLAGARETLTSCRPIVIFECFGDRRGPIAEAFDALRYRLLAAPFLIGERSAFLDSSAFLNHPGTNFVAIAAEALDAGRLDCLGNVGHRLHQSG